MKPKKIIIAVALAAVILAGLSCAQAAKSGAEGGRQIAAAPAGVEPQAPASAPVSAAAAQRPVFVCTSPGRWFPDDPVELRKMIDGFLDPVKKEKIDGRIVAVISPHAGYIYSGPVAAYAYKQLEGLKFDTVVVIGFSHSAYDPNIAVYEKGSFRTPLGDIPIDEDTVAALEKASPSIKYIPSLFSGEHSLDNQLPFLQVVLGDFKLVPILYGSQSPENIAALSEALPKVLKGKNALIVSSSDMSHYWPQDDANKLDAETIGRVKALDAGGVAALVAPDPSGRRLCGYGTVQAAIRASKKLGADEAILLKHATSQDTYGPTGNGVVGYMAVALVEKGGKNETAAAGAKPGKETKKMKPEFGGELTGASQKELLKISRNALETYIRTGRAPDVKSDNPQLQVERGVFVTLNINGALRGCMGHFDQDVPLYELVSRQAIVSATQDPRFPAVRPDELKNIDIEISVLSPPKDVKSYEDIVVGKHGVILRKGYYGATFLPQVAPEQGWDRDTMLTQLSLKAGLPPDAWKQGCAFQVYTAQVFGEKE
jgi:MEMO1 family protein